MSGYTVRVYNNEGRNVLTYDKVTIDNDLDPPYAVVRSVETNEPVALVPVTFVLEIVRE